jgi:hypothetical protein
MPYRPHSAYPSPYPPPSAVKKRPSWVWFVVGGLMMAAAAAIAVVTIVRIGLDISRSDAIFNASGAHTVTVPAGVERGLFIEGGNRLPRCDVSDSSGTPLDIRRPDSRFTFNEWVAVRVLDTGDGTLRFDCARGQVGQIRIAQVPSDGDLARAGVFGFFVPLLVGGIGFVMVLVTGILFYTRRPTAAYAPPPGWQPPTPGPPPTP